LGRDWSQGCAVDLVLWVKICRIRDLPFVKLMRLLYMNKEEYRQYIKDMRKLSTGFHPLIQRELGEERFTTYMALNIELGILMVPIIGFIDTIIREGKIGDGSVETAQQTIEYLEQQDIGRIESIRVFLNEHSAKYPQTRHFIIIADYLRLLAIEFLRLFQLQNK